MAAEVSANKQRKSLRELFRDYGVRPATLEALAQMGFTVNTLVNMRDQEIDYVIKMMVERYQVELLVGERFGMKSAVRAERRSMVEEIERQRMGVASCDRKKRSGEVSSVEDLTIEGLQSESSSKMGSVQRQPYSLGSENVSDGENSGMGKQQQKRMKRGEKEIAEEMETGAAKAVQLAPVIRHKNSSLDYLFDLYEEAGKYLEEAQQLAARERGGISPHNYDDSCCTLWNM